MSYQDDQYIVPNGIFWPEILRKDVPKSSTSLQPIYEAFTNAIEAIRDKQKIESTFKGEICMKIYSTEASVANNFNFSSLSITDNGIGFDNQQFERFNTFRDVRKNYKNFGSGRLQYAHYFDKTRFVSVFEDEGIFYEREFIVSKNEEFLKVNSIVKHKSCKETNLIDTGTTITLNSLFENSVSYNELNQTTLKEKLLERYIHYFCHNINRLPEIKIQFFIHSELEGESNISQADIPKIDKTQLIEIQYSKKTNLGIEKTNRTEVFKLDAFRISKKLLKENKLNLVSKGEVVEESYVSLESLSGSENVKGNKYLFLVSSNYIDERDTNLRGDLNIPSKEEFFKDVLAQEEEIFLEEIQEEVNNSINSLYPEIEEVKKKHNDEFEKLKEMFLLDDETSKSIKITINDSESRILEKFYEFEAKKSANIDASIKETFDNLNSLDTNSSNYLEDLKSRTNDLIKKIPFQNKKALSHYIARRKIVLELFQKILDKEIEKLNKGGRIDEDIMHNLIFQQSSQNIDESDLWLIGEEFIHFKGFSEKRLENVELNGKKIFKEVFSDEVERYLKSLGENRLTKRPDILLFPEEGKCILIEFKAPDVNVADYLTQIDFYANLIRNYTIDEIQITSFYGYLIGESIEDRDVRGRVTRFENSYHLGYWFRPSESVVGFDERKDGSIYTEVIKFSTLLKRAKLRNQIFIEKLGIKTND